jgi:DNA-binding NtrC family response regulator
VEEDIAHAARTDAKVLLTGESGVGKEVVARLIHRRSPRAAGPLVPINCAGIPETLLASELFGHVRGSFTDAHRDKCGLIEQAQGGTIFLDEVGEMSHQMQALLLRFLENGEIQRVGADRRPNQVNVRVITATNRSLIDRVKSHEFREDLFYRLNVIHIEIPPLRERRDDLPVLFDHFLRSFAADHGTDVPQISDDAWTRLKAYDWPGNVRELKNLAERIIVNSGAGPITAQDLPRELWQRGFALGPVENAAAPARADLMLERLTRQQESFWTVVHEPFMSREITRDELRAVVRRGLELTRGNYKSVVQLFNMTPDDYKRFLNFLRKYQLHMPIHEFRSLPVRLSEPADDRRAAVGE